MLLKFLKGVLTDVDLTNDQNLCDISFCAEWLLKEAEGNGVLPEERGCVELVLALTCPDPSQPWSWQCNYYFADHKKQVIFWLDDYFAGPILFNVSGVREDSHLSTSF